MSLEKVKKIAEEVVRRAKQADKISIFSIANTANRNNEPFLFPSIRETAASIAGNVLVTTREQVLEIAKWVDGLVDIVLLDAETKVVGWKGIHHEAQHLFHKSKVLTFKPNDMTVEAVDTFLAQMALPLCGKKIAVIGAGNIGSKVALRLVEREATVILTKPDAKQLQKIVEGLNCVKPEHVTSAICAMTDNLQASKDADIIIGCTPGIPAVTCEMVLQMRAGGMLLDVGNGTICFDAFETARKRGIQIFCLFVKPAYDGTLQAILETGKLIKKMGRRSLDGFSIISGGVMGALGDVIVDDVAIPRRILAIANGCGDVIPNIEDPRFAKNIEKVKAVLLNKPKNPNLTRGVK